MVSVVVGSVAADPDDTLRRTIELQRCASSTHQRLLQIAPNTGGHGSELYGGSRSLLASQLYTVSFPPPPGGARGCRSLGAAACLFSAAKCAQTRSRGLRVGRQPSVTAAACAVTFGGGSVGGRPPSSIGFPVLRRDETAPRDPVA